MKSMIYVMDESLRLCRGDWFCIKLHPLIISQTSLALKESLKTKQELMIIDDYFDSMSFLKWYPWSPWMDNKRLLNPNPEEISVFYCLGLKLIKFVLLNDFANFLQEWCKNCLCIGFVTLKSVNYLSLFLLWMGANYIPKELKISHFG